MSDAGFQKMLDIVDTLGGPGALLGNTTPNAATTTRPFAVGDRVRLSESYLETLKVYSPATASAVGLIDALTSGNPRRPIVVLWPATTRGTYTSADLESAPEATTSTPHTIAPLANYAALEIATRELLDRLALRLEMRRGFACSEVEFRAGALADMAACEAVLKASCGGRAVAAVGIVLTVEEAESWLKSLTPNWAHGEECDGRYRDDPDDPESLCDEYDPPKVVACECGVDGVLALAASLRARLAAQKGTVTA